MKLTRAQEEHLIQIGLKVLLEQAQQNGKAVEFLPANKSFTKPPTVRKKAKTAKSKPKNRKSWSPEHRAKYMAALARRRAEAEAPKVENPEQIEG